MVCYILESQKKRDKTYVGLTIKKLEARTAEHNKGFSKYTKAYVPWKLIYYENFYCKLCAEKREKFLKSGIGYKFRRLIQKYYKELK
ncbi:GIY-YIG nuclease family protein [Patescibacteria group bacterium]|nr:GIY-YIG nuclease family protein [Patescibacteria group bacterium]